MESGRAIGHQPYLDGLENVRDFFSPGPLDYRDVGRFLEDGFLTIFEADHPLGKQFSLQDGKLTKRTLGSLSGGTYRVVPFSGFDDLVNVLAGLNTRQVISASTRRSPDMCGEFTTKERAAVTPGAVHRGKEHFGLQRGLKGVLTIDYDPDPDSAPLSKDELWSIVCDCIPGVDAHDAIHWVSGSSCIFNGGVMLRGVNGQRVYILVQDVADIKRAMGVLQKRLWLAGHGRVMISGAGSLLHRTIADASLADEVHLDYAGGAVLRDGLEQRRPAPEVISRGGWLDTALALPDLKPDEESAYQRLVCEAERAAAPEAEIVKQRWVQERAKDHATKAVTRGEDYSTAYENGLLIARAAHGGVLLGDFPIQLDDGEIVTVSELLDNRERYHHRLTLDPLEPEYCDGKVTGKLFLFGACPNLHSFAHGSHKFRLSYQPSKIVLRSGRSAENAQEYLRRLAKSDDVFVKGSVPVRILDGLRALTNSAAMGFELGTRFATFKLNAKAEEVPADPPESVVKMVVVGAASELREVCNCVRHPFATENEIVVASGYHAATKTYAEFDPSDYAGLPAVPDDDEVIAALRTLWHPWEKFAFASNGDRAAMLGAILGVVCRPGVDIAPGILADAPVAGSGKTFLALTLGALATGKVPDVSVFAFGESDIELKKRLVSSCMGGDDVFVYDNVIGNFNSAVLAGCLTTGTIKDRILGASLDYTGPGPRHVILTANNLTLGVDLAVRFLRIRLDHRVANPATLRFDFHPVERLLSERAAVLRACLTVVRAFQAGGSPHHGLGGYRMASWDRLVRSCVIWLGRLGFVQAAGIADHDGDFDPAAGLLAATRDVGSGDEIKSAWFEHLHALTAKDGLTVGELLSFVRADQRFDELTSDLLNGKPVTRSTLRSALEIAVDQIVGDYRLVRWKDERRATWVYAVTRR
ncbi:MAG: hypothetical protein QM739_17880 [Propionivibrio sp.]